MRHSGDLRVGLDDGVVRREADRALRDVHGVIADALEVVRRP